MLCSHVLVTTDRAVGVVQYTKHHEYALHELKVEELSGDDCEVIASGVIEYPGKEAIAIAYAEDEKLFLHVVPADEILRGSSPSSAAHPGGAGKKSVSVASNAGSNSSSIRFELVAAPSNIVSVTALSLTGASEVFYGVILFRAGSMVAFGYIDAKSSDASGSKDFQVRSTYHSFPADLVF